MATSPDKQSLRTFLADTVTLLCKNFLHFESEFSVEGLIGITLDQKDVFLVSIHETVKSPDAGKVSTPKTTEILAAKATTESSITAACNVTLPQSVTVSTEDDGQNATVSHDSTDVEMLQDTDIARQPVARQPVARQPVILLPDDVIKGDDSAADVKLELVSVPDETHKMSNHDSSSRAIQNSVALPIVFDSHSSLEPAPCDNSKTLEKLDYFEKPGTREESRLARQSSESCRAGFSQSGGDFEVIEIKEESLSEDEFTVSNQNLQICREDFDQQGMSSAMDAALGNMGYSYWEGNPVQVINQSTMSISSSAPNPIGMPPVKRGPKTKKWKFYECLKCGSKLSTAYGLKKHDTVIHQGNYKYTCHLCGKGLRTEYNLRGHMASRHNMSKDYRCMMCAREFGYRHTLRDHMLACHGVTTTSVDLENSGLGT